MRKLIAVLILLSAVCSIVYADGFDVQGEWYVSYLHENAGYHVAEDGDRIVTDRLNCVMAFFPDGTIDAGGEIAAANRVALSDNAFLYYVVDGSSMFGYFIMLHGDQGSVYQLDNRTMLLYDGNVVVQGASKQTTYYQDHDQLYILDGRDYQEGQIIPLGNAAFIYQLAAAPETITRSDGSVRDLGKPFMVFFNTRLTD